MQQPNKNKRRPDTPLAPTPKVDYGNFSLARSYTNKALGLDENTPATRKDSTDYKQGFKKGIEGKSFTPRETPYGRNEYQKFGQWSGANVRKKTNSDKVKKTIKTKK